MERYLLIEILKNGQSAIVFTFFNSEEAEVACKDIQSKYPKRSFAIRVV